MTKGKVTKVAVKNKDELYKAHESEIVRKALRKGDTNVSKR